MHAPCLFPLTRFDDWLAFHRDNAAVYVEFLRLAREAQAAGFKRWGARNIWERMRYSLQLAAIESGADEYKLNDHHVPYYARLVMLRHPELAGLFVTKDSKFDTDPATLLDEADRIDRERGMV